MQTIRLDEKLKTSIRGEIIAGLLAHSEWMNQPDQGPKKLDELVDQTTQRIVDIIEIRGSEL